MVEDLADLEDQDREDCLLALVVKLVIHLLLVHLKEIQVHQALQHLPLLMQELVAAVAVQQHPVVELGAEQEQFLQLQDLTQLLYL
jgi:hypothetical protein